MSLNNFIPQVWSARLLENTHKNLVYAQSGVVNRDYEGDIADGGDVVRINSIGAVTLGTYSKNADIADPQDLSDAQTTMNIDQRKYFNFQVDDVDRAQGNPRVMDEAMTEAGYAVADDADQSIAGLYTDVAVANIIGSDTTPISLTTAANAYERLVDLAVLLTDAKVPQEGRWVIIPPWFYGLLLKDDRFVKAGTAATDAVLRTGQVGSAAGFMILQSHNVPNIAKAKYKIMAGHRKAISYADAIVKIEAYRPQKRFADAVKGLHVYGRKMVRPDHVALLVASNS